MKNFIAKQALYACLVLICINPSYAQSIVSQDTAPTSPEELEAIAQDEKIEILNQKLLEIRQELDAKASRSEINGMDTKITELVGSVRKNRDALTTVGSTMRPADVVWVGLCAILVFFMQPGFCLLELGFSRSKNVINVIMKNFVDFCVASLGYVTIGFGLMFGTSVMGLLGGNYFFLFSGAGDDGIWIFLIYQMMFVGTAATISSGAMAERTKFIGYILFSIFLSTLIYPIAGHWGWGGTYGDHSQGWLAALGFIDFAGSTMVHAVGGACALAGIIVLGPRVGRFAADGSPRLIVGHNLPFAALGTFILWFCWFGFNGGSTMIADGYIGRILVNTNVAAAIAGLTAMLSMWKHQGRPDLAITLNGALGGLVSITAGCHIVTPGSALFIGIIAGLLTTAATVLLEKLRLDDVVGAVPVHLFNGIWGTVAIALFMEEGFSFSRLGVQLLGSLACAAFAFAASYALFKSIDKTIGLRATDTEQEEGLDFHEHAATAYPEFHTKDQTL
ncbi:MAG: ammonium transporter [Verrucomicrobiota bacterium]